MRAPAPEPTPPRTVPPPLDVATQKYTLAFADEELEALEDVKLELRRRFDLRTSKVELVRSGLLDLIEDYRQRGEHSRIIQRLRARSRTTA